MKKYSGYFYVFLGLLSLWRGPGFAAFTLEDVQGTKSLTASQLKANGSSVAEQVYVDFFNQSLFLVIVTNDGSSVIGPLIQFSQTGSVEDPDTGFYTFSTLYDFAQAVQSSATRPSAASSSAGGFVQADVATWKNYTVTQFEQNTIATGGEDARNFLAGLNAGLIAYQQARGALGQGSNYVTGFVGTYATVAGDYLNPSSYTFASLSVFRQAAWNGNGNYVGTNPSSFGIWSWG